MQASNHFMVKIYPHFYCALQIQKHGFLSLNNAFFYQQC